MSSLDIINAEFNELTVRAVIEKPDTDKYKSWNTGIWVHCTCSCGNEIDAPLYGVKNGFIKSCGHLRSQTARESMMKVREEHPNPTAVNLTYEGKTMNITEWSKETEIPRSTIAYRLNKGLPMDKVLERKEN